MKYRAFFLIISFLYIITTANAQENAEGKRTFSLDATKGSTVIFTFGQSNAANHGQERYTPANRVYNYHKGIVYEGADPLVGPTGGGGSVWTRLADMMIDSGMADSVTIAAIAVGATDIASWSEGGFLYGMLTETLDRMLADGIVPDYILWHQGESDNIAGTSEEDYVKRFESIRKAFRDRGIEAPIYIAVASYHPDCIADNNGNDTNVRNAQKHLAQKYKDIHQGPDTDKLDKCMYRHDGVHFSSKGLEAHAKAWLRALK
ncbi:MAG: hypothetical protein IAC23_00750 [Bacteroidetes bacterium]|uniref:Sialate O-acetylesterase domain-containing protein n=1 Tax=Candidatus Cryptobacteroides merdavium TaxID=2840769 RepID=A0A9D9H7R0_9BACT|nr:hypothetical protein [Candidatus Cryptobacteroides merdavium]